MDLLKQYILDKGRKVGRQEASKQRLAADEHKGPEPEEVDLSSIRTDRINQKIFGQLLLKTYPTEANGIYNRQRAGTLTDDDRAKLEAVQNIFPYEVSHRKKLGATMENHITLEGIKVFSDIEPSSFGYYADQLKDRNRTVALMRDYFADLALRDEPEAAGVVGVFKKLQALEGKEEYKRALAQASKLAERGFTPDEFSVLEGGSLTPEEAEAHAEIQKKRAEEIREGYKKEKFFELDRAHYTLDFGSRWTGFGDRLVRLFGFSGPAANLARKEDDAALALDKREATELIKERVSSRMTGIGRMWNVVTFGLSKKLTVRRILSTISKVESSKAFAETEALLKEGGKLMGEAISKDKRFADELDEESRTRGGRQARAVVLDPIASENSMQHWQTIELNEKRYVETFVTWVNTEGEKWMETQNIKLSEIKDPAEMQKEAGKVVEEFTRTQTEDLIAKYGEGHWAQLFAASYRAFADEMKPYLLKELADAFTPKATP